MKICSVDVSALKSHEERYAVVKLFEDLNWDVGLKWNDNSSHGHSFYNFRATWYGEGEPLIPTVPKSVIVKST